MCIKKKQNRGDSQINVSSQKKEIVNAETLKKEIKRTKKTEIVLENEVEFQQKSKRTEWKKAIRISEIPEIEFSWPIKVINTLKEVRVNEIRKRREKDCKNDIKSSIATWD